MEKKQNLIFHGIFEIRFLRLFDPFSGLIENSTFSLPFQHSMIYFFHHYELPVIVQQAQLQQLLIRNGQPGLQRNRTNNRDGGIMPTVRRIGFLRAPWLTRLRRGRRFNDSNNNTNDLNGAGVGGAGAQPQAHIGGRAFLTQRIITLFRVIRERATQPRIDSQPRIQIEQHPNPLAATAAIVAHAAATAAAAASSASTNNSNTNTNNDTDTRSNFQRNFEENNFMFPPDILMRERDRNDGVTANATETATATTYSAVPTNNVENTRISTNNSDEQGSSISPPSSASADETTSLLDPTNPSMNDNDTTNVSTLTSSSSSSNTPRTTTNSNQHDEGGGSTPGSNEGL